ncbi:MAG TPA: hypothetical protein PLL20_15180 [Phycisphaerae bacterium]|nr:hypothetical protein [Phycisphaerae bacterium]HRR83954.1 hypothetical protein [Phycisphaerae bacterium]
MCLLDMTVGRCCGLVILLVVVASGIAAPTSEPSARTRPAETTLRNRRILERVRKQTPGRTPARFNAIPDRLADILIEKHLYKDGEVWGLAKTVPDQGYPYDEMGSCTFAGLVRQYNLYDKVGPLDDAARTKALKFWQSWQDPATGRFKDPRDPKRQVNEKYVVGLIGQLGGEPLYKWTTTGTDKKIETRVFLERSREDPDWQNGGWGVGSHTGFQAVEIFEAINSGQVELIPDLEKGVQQILSHQDPDDGLWGPPSAELMRRIGGTLKVIGRLYFKMGMHVPHTRELADAMIEHSRNGDWYKHGANSCVPRNAAEVTAYCLEVSDYRYDELLEVLESLAKDYESWVLPDGRTLIARGDPSNVGLQYTTLYGLGIIAAYLHWEDCQLPNPLADNPRGQGYRYQVGLLPDGSVKVIDTGAGKP